MEYQNIKWSHCGTWFALTALVKENGHGRLIFINHTGVASTLPPLLRPSPLSLIQWHPSKPWIAAAFTDGALMLVDASGGIGAAIQVGQFENISCLEWSSDGTEIGVCETKGRCCVFGVDQKRATTSQLKEYQLTDGATAMCTRTRDGKSVFVVADRMGTIHDLGEEREENIFQAEAEIRQLMFFQQKGILIAVTVDLLLYQIVFPSSSSSKEKVKAKLPCKDGEAFRMLLTEGGLLLMCSGEKDLRIWDLVSDENGSVSLLQPKGFEATDAVVDVSYCQRKGMITGGTREGKIASWRRRPGQHDSIEDRWRLNTGEQVGETIASLSWSPVQSVLAVNMGTDIAVMQDESNSIVRMRGKIAAVQTGQQSFSLINVTTGTSQDLKLDARPKGIFLAEKQLVVWSQDTITTFDVQSSLATFQSTQFACSAVDVALNQQNIYCIEGEKINVRTLQGTVKQVLSLPEIEGDPVCLSVQKNFMCVATSNGFLRIYDLSKREAKQEFHAKYVIEALDSFHAFGGVKLNTAGNMAACTYYESPTSVGEKVLVWDAEADSVGYFSFDKGMTDAQEYEAEAEAATSIHGARPVTAAARKMYREQSRYRMMLHRPGALHWDCTDSRFLVVECCHMKQDVGESQLLSLFCSSEHGLLPQDLQTRSAQCDQLIGVAVPFMYFAKKNDYEDDEVRSERIIGRQIIAKTLREFSGLENADEPTRKAMMDFCLYLTLGRMDDAFQAIKFIKSDSVWEHMARMAVKTRRLDVASVCLGHMGLARASRALRRARRSGAQSEHELCALLAVQLGMLEDAEILYKAAGRMDMVNKMQQARGNWNEALAIAEKDDRIHLRNTHYHLAETKELERTEKSIEEAIEHYEKSGTAQFEVPRMFTDRPRLLENYVRKKRDSLYDGSSSGLHRWWARFLESMGELDGAVNFYNVASDILAVVRIKCMQGKMDEAEQLAESKADRASCYHLGRIYEAEGDHQKAVHFYTKAHAYSSAIRIAREQNMKDRLANLCLQAGGTELVEAAKYYEDLPGYADKAVQLYHKAGMIGRALDLAFRTEQFSALDLVARDLDSDSDPNTLKRAAEFFANNQSYEKAVEFLCYAKAFNEAIDLCKARNVRISEKTAELLTPTKDSTPDATARKRLLEDVAALCLSQAQYQFAAKKYTQAGDKLQAMRALLKSGDTAKIRFFANTARNREIYILAANYLQSIDWRGNAELMRDIEVFYNKAQSHEHLASFYQACAYMEVEDYHDFDKASEALNEAAKALQKALDKGAKNPAAIEEQQQFIGNSQTMIKKFLKIKQVYESDPSDAVRQLTTFAEQADENDIIRPAHIFSLLINHHAGKEAWSAANRCIQQLKKQQPGLDLTTVVAPETLDKICDQLNLPRVTTSKEADSDGDDDGVDFSHAMKRNM